ncbi:hypothetical protein CFOL_v3_19962 [Cephalotus follicularis]|uniref:Uncharacterized protein n=1 Tax=Cephalotus follicularis TaxID=3775 RepID=A0A1Q3C8S1_CEPFO|nr:hypothetical protein CFOL_v3_19962 [Cephalotus follicularis]
MADLYGDWDALYKILPESIRLGVRVFQRVFWAFDAAIEAFTYCRPVICINNTHMGSTKENLSSLLVLIGMDSYSHWLSLSQSVNRMKLGCGLWIPCDRGYQ